jgi:hypothetical protein
MAGTSPAMTERVANELSVPYSTPASCGVNS